MKSAGKRTKLSSEWRNPSVQGKHFLSAEDGFLYGKEGYDNTKKRNEIDRRKIDERFSLLPEDLGAIMTIKYVDGASIEEMAERYAVSHKEMHAMLLKAERFLTLKKSSPYLFEYATEEEVVWFRSIVDEIGHVIDAQCPVYNLLLAYFLEGRSMWDMHAETGVRLGSINDSFDKGLRQIKHLSSYVSQNKIVVDGRVELKAILISKLIRQNEKLLGESEVPI